MSKARNRILAQAAAMGIYDDLRAMTPDDLNHEFRYKYKNILNSETKGFGFWLWKPEIIKSCLASLNFGDILHYVDVGCHLNLLGKKRMFQYFDILNQDDIGILAFEPKGHPKEILERGLEFNWPEYKYTKGDTLKYFNVLPGSYIYNSQQIVATTFFIKKTNLAVDIIDQWSNSSKILQLINDEKSKIDNGHGFIDHRHDQSILSIILKLNKVNTLPNYEIEYPSLQIPGRFDFNKIKDFPIHARRDRGQPLFFKIKKNISRSLRLDKYNFR
jgi:hypothetical protein